MDDEPLAVTTPVPALRPLDALSAFIARQVRAHWTLIKFMLVGLLGYLLYTATLFLTYDAPFPFMPDKYASANLLLFTSNDLRLLVGSILAAEVSITGGFFARDLWVFTDWPVVPKPVWVRFLQYQAKSIVSTLGIITVTVNVLTVQGDLPHYVSTPIGVAIAFAWNWLWEYGFIWRRRSQP